MSILEELRLNGNRDSAEALEKLINKMKEKGLKRQAVLLEHPRSTRAYLDSLLAARWEPEVYEALGGEAYGILGRFERDKINFFVKTGILAPNKDNPAHARKPEGVSSLRLGVGRPVTEKDLYKAEKLFPEIEELALEAGREIYAHVAKVTESNPDLIFEIYKDLDKKNLQLSMNPGNLRGFLQARIERIERLKELDAPDVVIRGELRMLKKRISGINVGSSDSTQDIYNMIFKRAEEIVSNEDALKQNLEGLVNEARERTIVSGRATTDAVNAWINKGIVSLGRDIRDDMTFTYSVLFENMSFYPNDAEEIEKIIKADSQEREHLCNYDSHFEDFKKCLTGLQQVLQGGPITNPSASRFSTLQNDAEIPNIEYPAEIKEKLAKIVKKMSRKMDAVPDMGNLFNPSRLLRRDAWNYSLKESEKNPFDVTFGNDSGCCIFVPEDEEEMFNGFSVPYYINSPQIRIFDVDRSWRAEGKINRKRVGMVLAFEADTDDHKKILVCNSLELSKTGIPRNRKAIQKMVGYAENWLAKYAEQFGYDGVVMGSHGYNTSANHTSLDKKPVEIPLRYTGEYKPFYSDIFEHNNDKKTISTRENSCYWIWRKA